MWFKPVKLMTDRGSKMPVVDNNAPLFSWGAVHEGKDRYQKKCRVKVYDGEGEIWDSRWVDHKNQEIRYAGKPFDSGKRYKWSVELSDNEDVISQTAVGGFVTALMEPWKAGWIDRNSSTTVTESKLEAAKYFRKKFIITKTIKRAAIFVCGIGYHHITLNGKELDDSLLQPAFSDYSKRCYYVTIPIEPGAMNSGENAIGIIVGIGRRSTQAPYLKYTSDISKVCYLGNSQLTAQLLIEYDNGEMEWILTDDSWLCGEGPVVYSDMCNGETYDNNRMIPDWNMPNFNDPAKFQPAVPADDPGGKLSAQLVEPIKIMKRYRPVSITNPQEGLYVVDFGQNMAGIIQADFPVMEAGTVITFRYAELTKEDGMPYFEALRSALATDKYIASGTGQESYKPLFTYHGFRYVQIEGWAGIPEMNSITALAIYTDIENESFFDCSNQVINQIHKACLQTEKSNIHGIATDCPQRDERQGWLNDATVRFEEMPYNFNVGRLFPKIVTDILDSQDEDGAIGCTAPFVFAYKTGGSCQFLIFDSRDAEFDSL
ncbi:MAG: family 78 glycoside hydrolase catalytic domain [Saccharofermentanales bacterium]